MKKRIAWVVPQLGRVYRGAEKMSLDLYAYLQREYDITLVCSAPVPNVPTARMVIPPGYDVEAHPAFHQWFYRHGLHPYRWGFQFSAAHLFMQLMRLRPDIVVGVTTAPWVSRTASLYRKWAKTPFVLCGQAPARFTMDEIQVSHPDVVVCINQASVQTIKQRFPLIRVVFIPNGVNIDQYDQPEHSDLHLGLETPVYLCVAAGDAFKRVDLAIQAVAQLPHGSLIYIGSGEKTREWVELGNRLLGPRRFFHGVVPFHDIQNYYRSCDVFTLPSEGEEQGIVYLEAMAANKPVVAPDDPARHFVVGDGGVLCRCEDVAAYAGALRDASGMAFGNRPRQQAVKFDWKVLSDQYKSLFEDLLKRPTEKRNSFMVTKQEGEYAV